MTYNKFNPTKTDTVTSWFLRVSMPYLWGPAAFAIGIATKTGWGILAGVAVLTAWLYMRTRRIRNRRNDKQRYQGSDVDLKWLSRAIRNVAASFEAAGLSISKPCNPDGPPDTPRLLQHGPCPQGSRWLVEPIPGVQHGGDFLDRLRNLESAFGRKLIVELSDDPRRVILIWRFSDPLSETRRPDNNPFGQ